MRIFFPEKDPEKIVDQLKEAMGDRALSKIVSFHQQSDNLTVKLSKLGTSTLEFSRSDEGDGSRYSLTKEKIALAHKALKGEVTAKIIKVIEKAGGVVDS